MGYGMKFIEKSFKFDFIENSYLHFREMGKSQSGVPS